MTIERSCGAVVYTLVNGEIRYVIIESTEGFFGFPKGHMESGETERETALREILEETGLRVELLEGFRAETSHPLIREGRPDVTKHVVYFLARYADQPLVAQDSELRGIRLMDLTAALAALQFEDSRRVLGDADRFLREQVL